MDVETGGVEPDIHALLEISAVLLCTLGGAVYGQTVMSLAARAGRGPAEGCKSLAFPYTSLFN